MNDSFVALDLETTGLDPATDRITEIGAVRFSLDGCETETFHSLVNPGREIPPFVESLTGISNADIAGAPALQELAPRLLEFVGTDTLVGHNVAFDLGCLGREGVLLRGAALDTAHLARILLPAGRSRSLAELARELGIGDRPKHRALDDARTSAALLVALAARAQSLPHEARLQLARLASMESVALAELIAGSEWTEVTPRAHGLPSVRGWKAPPPLEAPASPRAVRLEDTEQALAGAAAVFAGFEDRQEQRQMAGAVTAAFAEGGHWLIEAGTGVGKSLAYLIPAALHALGTGQRVVISTSTINLQEQLLTKDIPALRRMLVAAGLVAAEGDLRVALLKGRSNYLCLRRWMAAYGSGAGDADFARLASQLLLWLPMTETGDRGELNLDGPSSAAWHRFSAQDTDCLARPSVLGRDAQCFLYRARRAAEAAHLVIVNHALLLADAVAGGSALPAYQHLIVDEAHNLEERATQQFGDRSGRGPLAEALAAVWRPAARDQREGGVATVLAALPDGPSRAAGEALKETAAGALRTLPALFELLGRLVDPESDDQRQIVSRALRSSPDWTPVELAWDAVDEALAAVVAGAALAAETVAETGESAAEEDVLAGEVLAAGRRVEEARAALERLLATPDDEMVVWITKERDGNGSVSSAPLDVGPALAEVLFRRRSTVVATSATLAAGTMEWAARRLGLPDAQTLQVGSPFEYERAALLAVVTDVPDPGQRGYLDGVSRAIVELATAADGRTLALFTSHSALREVAGRVRTPLREAGIAVLAQDIDGPPRQLIERLVERPRTVILGTASFWEGVDVRGEALSLLVIARLPFAVPTDPIQRARSELYEDPFRDFSLPAALLRFRQGFGRLIRHRTDRGVVAVLDRRIVERGYGADFVRALPSCARVRAGAAVVAEHVREWLDR